MSRSLCFLNPASGILDDDRAGESFSITFTVNIAEEGPGGVSGGADAFANGSLCASMK